MPQAAEGFSRPESPRAAAMPAPLPPQKLGPLIAYLESLRSRASIDRLRELLHETKITAEDLHEFVTFDAEHYRRNLVALGPWYEILVICWQSGQRSPIHNHARSTCGLKVLAGVCTETVFDRSPCGQVVALSSTDLTAGYITASQDTDTHQVSNLQPEGQELVTLHIYSPPLRSMQKFSIVGGRPEEWRPPVFEFAEGAGI
jgi:cysteine dioxygenase